MEKYSELTNEQKQKVDSINAAMIGYSKNIPDGVDPVTGEQLFIENPVSEKDFVDSFFDRYRLERALDFMKLQKQREVESVKIEELLNE